MVKLRNMVMAMALGTGAMGCSFAHWSIYHCDECDDFPMPGAGATSMMPGTYTGPPPKDMTGSTPPENSAPAATPAAPADPFSPSPPPVPSAR